MISSWPELLTGLALAMVLEGVLPFLSPRQFRERMLSALQLPNGALRLIGLLCMLAGLLLLYLVR